MSIFRVKKALLLDQLHTFRTFYKNPRFALIDLSFGLFSLFQNPYRTCRKFFQKKGAEEIYVYGETPFRTYAAIAKAVQLSPTDCWLELGAGRGKGCFWLSQFYCSKVIGIEWIPSFVFFARIIKSLFRIKNLSFQQQNYELADFSTATVFYLYGTWLPVLNKKIETMPANARIVTISYELEHPELSLVKTFPVKYPWGDAIAFVHHKRDCQRVISS